METEVEKIFENYSEQNIKQIKFNLNNVNQRDKEIINNLTDDQDNKNIQLKALMNRVVEYFGLIRSQTLKSHNLNAHVLSSKNEDELTIDCTFDYKRFIISPINFFYFLKKNSFQLKGNLVTSNNRFIKTDAPSFISENEISFGFDYNQNFNKKSVFLQNQMYLNNNCEVKAMVKNSKMEMDFKRNQSNHNMKLVFTKNFNERPFLFREKWIYDKVDQLNFQIGHKIIKNYVDETTASPELVSKLPHQDSQIYTKVSYCYNKLDNLPSTFKISSSLNKSLNSVFMRNKLFYRKFWDFDLFSSQFNFELGNVLPVSNNELRIHETFYIDNFKGIRYPNRKANIQEGNIADSLGIYNYLLLSNKIIFENFPLFNSLTLQNDGIQLIPFIHFNLLFTPKTKYEEKGENIPYRFSTGLGLTLITEGICLELYYNAFIKKQNNEIASQFSFNFGLD